MLEILEMKDIKDATPEELKKFSPETKEPEKPEWHERVMRTFLANH